MKLKWYYEIKSQLLYFRRRIRLREYKNRAMGTGGSLIAGFLLLFAFYPFTPCEKRQLITAVVYRTSGAVDSLRLRKQHLQRNCDN